MIHISIIIGALFLFFAIAIKHLKWYGLIAGYNTAKPEYREKVDIEKIGNLMGIVFYFLAGIWLINGALFFLKIDNTGFPAIIGTLIGIIYVVIKAQMYDNNPGQKLRLGIAVVLLMVICGTIAGLLYYGAKEPTITFAREKLTISGVYGVTVPYSDISEVVLKDDVPIIKNRTNGFGLGVILKGMFTVEGFAATRLFLQSKQPPYVYMRTKNEMIIFNSRNSDKTKMWYIRIDNKIKPKEKTKNLRVKS